MSAGRLLLRAGRRADWHPLVLPRTVLVGFFNADDHGTVNMTDDGAGLISTWKDCVSGMAPTAAAGARPTWASNSFNGAYADVGFDGTDDCLRTTTFTPLPTGSAASEVWAVVRQSAVGAVSPSPRGIMRYGGTSAGTIRALECANVGSVNRLRVTETATNINDASTLFEGHFIVGGRWNGTTQRGRINGSDTNPASTAISALTTGTTRLALGSGNATTAANFLQGGIRYLFFIAGALADADMYRLEGWSAWNSGLQASLPSSHPYRLARP